MQKAGAKPFDISRMRRLFCIKRLVFKKGYILFCVPVFLIPAERKLPKTPQERNSPMPTVTIKNQREPSAPYTFCKIKGTIAVLARIGGRGAAHTCFFKAYVPNAPKSVASVPNTTSQITQPVRKRKESTRPLAPKQRR